MIARSAGFLLVMVMAAGAARAGEAAEDEEVEPVYARAEVLAQRGPRLGRHGLAALLEVAYPGIRRPGRDTDPGEPVIGRVLALKDRFLILDDEVVRPGPEAVALLVIRETDLEGSLEWFPELVVVGLSGARPKVLGRRELDDLVMEFVPAQDAGSNYRLEAFRLHPRGVGINVRMEQDQVGTDGQVADAKLQTFLIGQDGELVDVLMEDVLRRNQEQEPGGVASGDMSQTRLSVDRSRLINGFYLLEVERYSSRSEGGRIRNVEIEYEWQCWRDGGYDLCDEEELDPPAR